MSRTRVAGYGMGLFAVAAAAAAWWVTGQSDGGNGRAPRVVLVTAGKGPFWQLAASGARAAALAEHVDLQLEMPDERSLPQQMAILASIDGRTIDGLAICPMEADAERSVIDDFSRSTRVVTFECDAPGSQRACYVGMGDYSAGRLCAELVGEALPAGGEIAVLGSELEQAPGADRVEGFQAALVIHNANRNAGAAAVEAVAYLADQGVDAARADHIRRLLATHPNLRCVVDVDSRPCGAALAVLREAGQLGAVKFLTFDQSDETLDAIARGEVYAAVVRDPYQYGYQSVRRLVDYMRRSPLEIPAAGAGSTKLPGLAVRKDNLADFRTRQASAVIANSGG